VKPRAKSCRRSPRPRAAIRHYSVAGLPLRSGPPGAREARVPECHLNPKCVGRRLRSYVGLYGKRIKERGSEAPFEFFRKDCWLARYCRFSSPSYWSTSTSFSRFPPWRTAYSPAVMADTFSEVHSYAMGTISLAMPFGRHPNLSNGLSRSADCGTS
jgi:hypothetical protein